MATTATVVSYLFMYSIAMFTLPFVAFFGMKRFISDYFEVEDFTNTIYSVLAAVAVVHIVIALYVRHAMMEMRADGEMAPQPDVSKDKSD